MMGRHKVALAVALAIPLAGFGLRPAMAGSSGVCGSVTRGPGACEQGGIDRSDLYQRSLALTAGTTGTESALCDGGPSADTRDTALHDNLFELLIAQSDSDSTVAQVTDSTGRLVGYTVSGHSVTLGAAAITLYVTCLNDH